MRFIKVLAFLVATTMAAALPIGAFAAQHDVTSAQDITDVIDGTVADADDEITFDLQNDIDCSDEEWDTQNGKTYTINGNDYSLTDVTIGGQGTVTINADVKGLEHDHDDEFALTTEDSAKVTVNGDVETDDFSFGVSATGDSDLTITGNVTSNCTGVNTSETASVTVEGNVTGGDSHCAIWAEGTSNVTVGGNVDAGNIGVRAYDDTSVLVGGNASGSWSGVSVGGNAQVTVEGDVSTNDYTGHGVYGIDAYENSTVTIEGSIDGGDYGISIGILAYDNSTVTVGGTVTAEMELSEDNSGTVTILNGIKNDSDTNTDTPSAGEDSNVNNNTSGIVDDSNTETQEPEILPDSTDTTYTVGSADAVKVHCTGDVSDFVSLSMDGNLVDSSNYTLEDGSTIVTLKQSYADSLTAGKHTMTLIYTNGSVDTELVVSAKSDASSDMTADTENDMLKDVKGDTSTDTKSDTSTDTNGGTSTSQQSTGTSSAGQTSVSAPKTGDDNMTGAWVVVSAAAVAVIAASKRKKNA